LRLLKENNTKPKLWCLLGDVQGEIQHYEKAWECSGHTFSRAMRSLGARYFHLENVCIL
jgi:hypothetical protein